jgi:hypothetical protein
VGATGESQGRDRRQRDRDASHKLHGDLPPYGPAAPFLGDTRELSADPHQGDKPAHRATSYGLDASICFKGLLERGIMEVLMAAPSQTRAQSILAATCVIATVGLVIALNARSGWDAQPRWLLWAVLVAGVELLPVATWRGLTLSVGPKGTPKGGFGYNRTL